MCDTIVSKLRENKDLTSKLLLELKVICKMFPPSFNSNKMVYGKLAELSLYKCLKNIFKIYNLDEKFQNSFANDCLIEVDGKELSFSIKTTKVKGKIRLINKHSNKPNEFYDETIKGLNMIIISLYYNKIFIFPMSIFNSLKCVKHKTDGIDLQSKFWNIIIKNYPQYVLDLEECTYDVSNLKFSLIHSLYEKVISVCEELKKIK